jgi:preprotein translocase subunit YajC
MTATKALLITLLILAIGYLALTLYFQHRQDKQHEKFKKRMDQWK